MTALTPQTIEFMLMTGMSDDPKQDVSKLPVMEQVAIYSMNYTQQQSDVLKTQQSALSQITEQINDNNYVSQLAEIRSKILSGTYSWPTDPATSSKLVTALNTDAAFGNWATPPTPPATAPAISYDDYKTALANGQSILNLLTPAPIDGTTADDAWPSDRTLAGALVSWCDAKGVTFPQSTLNYVSPHYGLNKLPVPTALDYYGWPAYVDASGTLYQLLKSNSVETTFTVGTEYDNVDTALLTGVPGTAVSGVLAQYATYPLGSSDYVFIPDKTIFKSFWSDPTQLATINGSGAALPLWQDTDGKTYIWTIDIQIDLTVPRNLIYLQDWIAGHPAATLQQFGDLVRYEPPPTPATVQKWSSTFNTQQATLDSNNRQLNSDAQSQMLEVQLAGTDYENGQQYASGALGKNNDSMSGIIRNF